ncbi:MAG: phosphatase PAP2 family protein [Bacteroidota bacterium]|nr:phosphatase PAP2 family protein [Flavisolibacter sp.]MDQ3842906.1 phosphatase PAP2 family protein [Bacteroidota bacterium]
MRNLISTLLFFFLQIAVNAQNDTTSLQVMDSTITDTIIIVHSSENMDTYNSVASEKKEPVYKLKPIIDVPVAVPSGAWTLYAFSKIYSKDPSSIEKIQSLRTSDINGFDRWIANTYSEKAADASDLLFYGSMPLPVLFLADNKMRKDIPKLTFLYLEAMSVTGLLYTGSTYLFDRYRPYAYNPKVPIGKRTRGGAKNSFFAGHVALVGTSTFFMAKTYADYHPDIKAKWIPYALAIAATGTTAYLRLKGGMHFPSDVLIGTAVGTLSGLLVPHFHRNKLLQNENVSISPFFGKAQGLILTYAF